MWQSSFKTAGTPSHFLSSICPDIHPNHSKDEPQHEHKHTHTWSFACWCRQNSFYYYKSPHTDLDHWHTVCCATTELHKNIWLPKSFKHLTQEVSPCTSHGPLISCFLVPLEICDLQLQIHKNTLKQTLFINCIIVFASMRTNQFLIFAWNDLIHSQVNKVWLHCYFDSVKELFK